MENLEALKKLATRKKMFENYIRQIKTRAVKVVGDRLRAVNKKHGN